MTLDAIIIGGGHNGLVCAAYLAKSGKQVLVLERNEVVGGAAVTEELPMPSSKVTGGSGNTERGSLITYSGGARG